MEDLMDVYDRLLVEQGRVGSLLYDKTPNEYKKGFKEDPRFVIGRENVEVSGVKTIRKRED